MDESQGSPKKILAAKFFDKVAEIDQVANSALANSIALQSELSTVQIDLRSLIESLQVNFDSGIQNVQTQINEVTNVVIEEQNIRKSETEALEQQIFAQEDQLQKDVIGKKSKTISPDSFSGKMRQKLRDKAKENQSSLGLLAGGIALTSLSGVMPNSTEENGDGNWFSGLWDRIRNFDGTPGSGLGEDETPMMLLDNGELNPLWVERYGTPETADDAGDANDGGGILPEGDEIVNEETTETSFLPSFGDMKEGLDALTLKPLFDQLYANIKALIKSGNGEITEEVTSNDNEEVKEFNEETRQLKNLRKYNPRDVILAAVKSYNDGGTGIAGFNEETGKIEVTSHEELEAHKKAVLSTKAGEQPGGGYSTYAANTVYSQFMGFDDGPTSNNNSNNEVVDGGTTVIEGTTEVVDGGTVANNQRGEVRASTSLVKSTNSPVTAVKLSENNSVKELAIGA